jgi:hypothetical protein
MARNLFFVFSLCLISPFVNAITQGCALSSLGDNKAKKLAEIRAKSEFIKKINGVHISGSEMVLVRENDNKAKSDVFIHQKSSGLIEHKLKVTYMKKVINNDEFWCAVIKNQ